MNVDSFLDSGLFDSVKRSIEHADHLTDGDEGAVAATLNLAQLIQDQSSAELLVGDAVKTLNTSYQTLQRYLTELGLSPQGRKNLGLVGDDDDDEW